MNILVTGGAGYIGSHFAKAARKAGLTPVVLDNLSSGHERFVKFGPFVHADIRDTGKVERAIRDHSIQAVVHFAAKSLVGESMMVPDRYYSNNVSGTLSVLQAMKETGLKTIVFSSSAATYGVTDQPTIAENHLQKPINPYGRSKLFAEQMLLDFEMSYGFRFAILRYFNVMGEDAEGELWEDHNPETHLIPNLVLAMNEKRPFQVFGTDYPTPDGTCVRDYVDVVDLAQAHLKALSYLNTHKRLISNVGIGRGYSVKEVFGAFSRVFEMKMNVEEKPRRIGDPPQLVADAQHFKTWCDLKLKGLEESLVIMRENRKRGRK